ncbi:hypothetical protein CEV31_0259 [Brucella thiophenivorans]|uniref:Uncharacterized protein n=1 Tax=Brucella thiophenivorans TaxID=571255 RepID=A0A256G5X4_9HYPH|nr:hypothetical protein CEV31_0259 [Brucella thiophenivorans]
MLSWNKDIQNCFGQNAHKTENTTVFDDHFVRNTLHASIHITSI